MNRRVEVVVANASGPAASGTSAPASASAPKP
jgi:hypothetical protein